MRVWHLWLCPLLRLSVAFSLEDLPDYRNPNLPIEQRAADLLQRVRFRTGLQRKEDQYQAPRD